MAIVSGILYVGIAAGWLVIAARPRTHPKLRKANYSRGKRLSWLAFGIFYIALGVLWLARS